MKQLLYKEWRLAMHPTALLFLGLSLMLLIPNYPYYVTFFYTTLGIFFICVNGRENRDITYMLTDGKTTWIWYDSDRTAYSGPAGEITADEEQHIPTYEDVLDLKPNAIAAADYRVYSGQNCIYVETEPDPDGYVLRYWISVEGMDSMGLLVGAEQLKDGQTVYRMTAQTVEGSGPTTKNFTLPDGTVLREIGT